MGDPLSAGWLCCAVLAVLAGCVRNQLFEPFVHEIFAYLRLMCVCVWFASRVWLVGVMNGYGYANEQNLSALWNAQYNAQRPSARMTENPVMQSAMAVSQFQRYFGSEFFSPSHTSLTVCYWVRNTKSLSICSYFLFFEFFAGRQNWHNSFWTIFGWRLDDMAQCSLISFGISDGRDDLGWKGGTLCILNSNDWMGEFLFDMAVHRPVFHLANEQFFCCCERKMNFSNNCCEWVHSIDRHEFDGFYE